MENQNRTLASVTKTNQQIEGQQGTSSQDNPNLPFWMVYSIQLAQRFPSVADIDVNVVRHSDIQAISDFSLECSKVGLNTLSQNQQPVLRSESRRTG